MIKSIIPTIFLVVVLSLVIISIPSFADAKKPAQSNSTTQIIDINKASVQELAELPGIGLKIAGRIVEYRNKNGKFKNTEELMNVRGISEKKYERIKNLVKVEKIPFFQ